MIDLDNQTNYQIDIDSLNSISSYLDISSEVELLIVDDRAMQTINKEHRGVDKSTDVLSFPLGNIEHMPLGSIVISIDKAKKLAQSLKHTIDDEICLLFTHGLLHILGYNHESDSGEMRTKEEDIIQYFSLPKSLIVRTYEET